jgi:hypothetical protein
MLVVFLILDAKNYPLNFHVQQQELPRERLVVDQDRQAMILLAYSAAFGYSKHSPKI